MQTIGLIGGMSWESTAVYYRLLNEGVRARVGGLASAPLILASVDFAPLAAAMADGRWGTVETALAAAARQLRAADAACIALCTNTMHKLAEPVIAAAGLPFVDIRDVTGRALRAGRIRRPLLLATRYTMEQSFWRSYAGERFGLEVAVPDAPQRETLQAIIFDELCRGIVSPDSKASVLRIINQAVRDGCDALVLGCTELDLLLSQTDSALPIFDTTALHCEALLNFSLSKSASHPA